MRGLIRAANGCLLACLGSLLTAGSSANSNGVALPRLTVSYPPTQGEVQSIADKVDEWIGALRR